MFQTTTKLRDADVALFTGGEDVTPSMYGEPVGRFTGNNLGRDKAEALAFDLCNDMGVKKLGICRGSQFLTVMSGGSLIQDVTGHGGTHEVYTDKGDVFLMSSTHHQMMNPFVLKPGEFVVRAWAEKRSINYLNGWNQNVPEFRDRGIDPEVVWYPKTKSLCIQPHPELMRPDSPGVEYCRQLVREHLLG